MGLSARAPHLTDGIRPSLGRVYPGVWWSWVLNPGLHLKNKGNESFPKGLGHPPLKGCLWQRSRGAPAAPLTLHLCDFVFQCPRPDVVAAAALPLQLAPPHHGFSEGLCFRRLSDHPAVLLLNTRCSLGREGGAVSWAAILGVRLALPSDWSRFHCLNAGWSKIPGSSGSMLRNNTCGNCGVWAFLGGAQVKLW